MKDSSTLICRKPSEDSVKSYIEEELIDGLCCYSAVNQGQLNEEIVGAVVHHLQNEKLPTVPRSIRHKYMSAFFFGRHTQGTRTRFKCLAARSAFSTCSSQTDANSFT